MIPLGLVYGKHQGGISLTRYQDREIPVIDVDRRLFGNALDLLSAALPRVSNDPAQNYLPFVTENQHHLMILEDF